MNGDNPLRSVLASSAIKPRLYRSSVEEVAHRYSNTVSPPSDDTKTAEYSLKRGKIVVVSDRGKKRKMASAAGLGQSSAGNDDMVNLPENQGSDSRSVTVPSKRGKEIISSGNPELSINSSGNPELPIISSGNPELDRSAKIAGFSRQSQRKENHDNSDVNRCHGGRVLAPTRYFQPTSDFESVSSEEDFISLHGTNEFLEAENYSSDTPLEEPSGGGTLDNPGGFRLPLDPAVRLKWLEAIKWPIIPLEPKKTAIVCPTHFTESDFSELGEGKKILKKDVIPSVFPWNSTLWSKEEMEGTAALRSPSTTDEEEVEKVNVEGDRSCESDVEIESLSSSSEESSEDQAAEVVADEIVTISSDDDDDPPSHSTSGDPEKSPTTVWESSPACRETVKRSAPSSSQDSDSTEKRRRLEKRQYDIIFTTSRSSSCSSDKEEPTEKSEAKPEVSTLKNEDGADSDGSDCILCEKPIESIDLTNDDRIPEPSPGSSPSRILFEESFSSDDEDRSEEAVSILESSPPVLLDKELSHVEPISETDAEEEVLMKKASSSEDSDCAIIESNPPTIEICSDDEGAKSQGGDQEEVDPFAGITNGEIDPLADVPSESADPLTDARGPVDSTSPPVPSPSGNMSPVASKDPNAPLMQKNPVVIKAARSLYYNSEKEVTKKKIEGYISPAELPRDYEIIGIHPTSKTLRIVLAKKKAPKPDVPEKMQVSVDPMNACLHDVPTLIHKNHINRSISQVISAGKVKNVYPVTRRDLVTEESKLQSIVLHRDELGFEPHCDALSRKLVDIIRKSQVMAGRLSQETMLSMYNLLFLTEISYGIIYWGHCEGAHNIFDLQKRFVGMMAHKDKVEMKASRATFCMNGILTLPSIYILHCLIHVHKNLDAVKNRVAQSLRLPDTAKKELKMANRGAPTFEVQGLEFYMALPSHLHAPHCSTPKFILIVKKFLRQNGLFNALEYYDMVNTIPKYIKK